jgi:ribosome-associated protein
MEKINYKKLAKKTVDIISDKKGVNILAYDVRKITSFTEFIIIATTNSEVQMSAIVKELREKIKVSSHIEGEPSSGWVLIDYDGLIINLFLPHEREFYGLERLWGDAERLDI